MFKTVKTLLLPLLSVFLTPRQLSISARFIAVVVSCCAGLFTVTALAETTLPHYAGKKHMGIATCASTQCHGSTKKYKDSAIRRNEYRIWIKEDPHSKAYTILKNRESKQIAQKMGLKQPAHQADVCLDCHADNVPKNKQGKKFQLSDGVGCEACHGGSEDWLESHAEKNATHQDNLKRGLYPTDKSLDRARLCLSCHFGLTRNGIKFATHEIMAAGHPRLSFELDTFTVKQEHYQVDKDYIKRKGFDGSLKIWILGMTEMAMHMLNATTHYLRKNSSLFPEIAIFDCHACHHAMNDKRWTSRATTQGLAPGAIRLNDSSLVILYVILTQVDSSNANGLLSDINNLHAATQSSGDKAITSAEALKKRILSVAKTLENKKMDKALAKPILSKMLTLGGAGEFRDYSAAEQALMAIDLLLYVMGKSDAYASQTDGLYKLLAKESDYSPAKFASALKKFSQKL